MFHKKTSQTESLLRATVLLGSLAACSIGASLKAANPEHPSPAAPTQAHAHDFDFLMGDWKVSNRFLTKRLQHSDQWIDFESTTTERQQPTRFGNIEVYKTSHWPDYIGMAIRLYDPDTDRWTDYWTDNRFSRGLLQPALVGSFKGGTGVFEGDDSYNGTPIVVRVTWRDIDHDHARWEQAFSTDHGKTWETNWIMGFARTSGTAATH